MHFNRNLLIFRIIDNSLFLDKANGTFQVGINTGEGDNNKRRG